MTDKLMLVVDNGMTLNCVEVVATCVERYGDEVDLLCLQKLLDYLKDEYVI